MVYLTTEVKGQRAMCNFLQTLHVGGHGGQNKPKKYSSIDPYMWNNYQAQIANLKMPILRILAMQKAESATSGHSCL